MKVIFNFFNSKNMEYEVEEKGEIQMTNKDRIEKFKNEKIAINCETIEEAKEFIKWCYASGMRLRGCEFVKTYFNDYKDKICYSFNFSGNECLGYCSKQFYKEEGYEIIKYKDFMKEDKMTNLEVAVSKGLIEEGIPLCRVTHICKYRTDCEGKECFECEFDNDINLCVQELLHEHKEPIKLKQWEYDLIRLNDQPHTRKFNSFNTYRCMKEKGYFRGITDISMTLQGILDNCKVVEDE